MPSSPLTCHSFRPCTTSHHANIQEMIAAEEGGVEQEERALLQNLGPWLDPTPLLPHCRLLVRVSYTTQRVTYKSNTNALIAARIRTPLKQLLQLSVSWEEESEKSAVREDEMVLWPQRAFWMCPITGREVEVLGAEGGELYQSILIRPSIPRNMLVLF